MELIDPPFFSIIVPAFNCKPFIINTIDSVKAQTFKDWELIIVDDNSTDGTYELIDAYVKEHSKIKLLKTKVNYGSPGVPRDKGVQEAKGKYVAFLDGDDIYHPQKFERHFKTISNNPTIEFIHSAYNIISEEGSFIKYKNKQWFLKIYERLFKMKTVCLLTNPFCVSTTVIKKSLIVDYKFGVIPKWISAVEDWFIWNRLLSEQKILFHYDKEPLTNYRWVTNSISDRDAHRCELQSIIFFSMLLYNRKINFLEYYIAILIRLARIFCTTFLGYGRSFNNTMITTG